MKLDDWLTAVATELGIPAPDQAEVHAVLDLARDAAHGVARPAAPLTTFLVGVAVGRGATLTEAAQQVTALVPKTNRPAD
jgi:hypothetical protein